MQISRFDRFLMSLAPRWGMNRLRARAAAELLARHYEAAMPGRRTSGWSRNFGDADVTIRGSALELRIHARDLIRNNAWARRAQRTIATNTVGWGIVPSSPSTKAMEIWKAWAGSSECESEGRHNFYGVQHLAMKSIAESGEVLIRRRWRRASDGLTIPLQLQVLEADFLDHAKQDIRSQAGGPIVQGVEFDQLGRRAAYWLFPQHPGSGRNAQASQRISADDVLHIYYTERPGQSRGVSWFSPAILPLKDFDDYEDATLVRQRIAACFGAFVTDTDGAAVPIGETSTDTSSGQIVEEFQPGMITELPPGKEVTFATPPAVTEDAFTVRNLRRIAAAIGVTYEDMTGDYSQVNFSSARMARLAHWGHVNDWRWNMLIPLLCDGVWGWAMQAAVAMGVIDEAPPALWTPPPMPMLEPDKEGLAYQRLVRIGAMTHDEMVREQGGDPDRHWKEYAAGLKKLDELGITVDSDARKVTATGQAQSSGGTSAAGESSSAN